jgi:hypothetical protein
MLMEIRQEPRVGKHPNAASDYVYLAVSLRISVPWVMSVQFTPSRE